MFSYQANDILKIFLSLFLKLYVILRERSSRPKNLPLAATEILRYAQNDMTEYSIKTKNPPYGEFLVSAERFELSTNGLKGRCSAVELRAHHFQKRTAFYHGK